MEIKPHLTDLYALIERQKPVLILYIYRKIWTASENWEACVLKEPSEVFKLGIEGASIEMICRRTPRRT